MNLVLLDRLLVMCNSDSGRRVFVIQKILGNVSVIIFIQKGGNDVRTGKYINIQEDKYVSENKKVNRGATVVSILHRGAFLQTLLQRKKK